MTLCNACRELRAGGSADDLATSPTPPETVPPAKASVPTVSGAASAILAQQDPSPTSGRPLWRQPPNTVSEDRAPEEQVRRRLLDERGWACDHAHGAGMLGTDEGSNAVVLTDGFRAN